MSDEQSPLCLLCGRRRPHIGVCCAKCRDTLQWRLNEIQELFALLPAMMLPSSGSTANGGKVGKRDAGPLPGREIIMTLMGRSNPDDAVHMRPTDLHRHDQTGPLPTLVVLDQWVRLVSEERRFTGLDLPTVPAAATFLRRHLDWICEQGWADDFAHEITRTHNTLRSICGEHKPEPIGTCPVYLDTTEETCGTTLYASTYSDVIQCRGCKTVWNYDQWKILGQSMGKIA